MAKKRAGRQSKRGAATVSSDPGGALAATALAAVLAGVPLFVDSGADASFDAPKRLVALVGLALAAAAALAFPRRRVPRAAWTALPAASRLAILAVAGAFGWALVAALVSSRRLPALDALRASLLLGLALPLGASRAVGRMGRLLAGVFLLACAVDAAVSIAQSRGWYQPFALVAVGMRDATGAYVGNVGYLATALALCAVLALAILLTASSRALRVVAAVLLALFVAGLAVNQNLTALSAALAGFAVALAARFGRRAAVPILAGVAALALVVAAYRPLRERVVEAGAALRAGDWDRLTTYRGGPWTAALEMARERPLLGFGPGSFGAEFVPHRLAAEIRYRRRFVNPLGTSSYGEAHCDYLQPFAEAGLPAGLAALAAAGLAVVAAARLARKAPEGARGEPLALFALLSAGAVAALTWFPLQRPITAVALLLAAGRVWRLAADAREDSEAEIAPADAAPWLGSALVRAALVVLLGVLVWPELSRYGAERKLRSAQGAFRFVLTRTKEVSDPPAALRGVAAVALEAAHAVPGDPRGLAIAAGSRLAGSEPDQAIELYRQALATGERAELDLNVGRAFDVQARSSEAAAWFLRGGWVSPPLLTTLLPDVAGPAQAEVARLEAELKAGRLKSPPPLP